MKLHQLIRTILNLLGIYTIFSSIIAAGMSVILIPTTMFYQGMEGAGWSTLMVLFQFFLPVLVGVLIVWKSKKITEWILNFSGIDAKEASEQIEIKEFPFVAFSLLGLYMLSQTLPSLFHFVTYLFQMKVQEASYLSVSEGRFLEQHLADLVYHFVAVGFSILVFMKGKSFAKFALSIRRGGVHHTNEHP